MGIAQQNYNVMDQANYDNSRGKTIGQDDAQNNMSFLTRCEKQRTSTNTCVISADRFSQN